VWGGGRDPRCQISVPPCRQRRSRSR
jgi:hypothetical protein